MCGISGELSFDVSRPVSVDAVGAMTATLQHRGPDHGATYRSTDGALGLGFRRLSIIDLRTAANQPIGNEDGSVQLVFNGEIYNYRELRQPLVDNGHVFRSNADSEVIVHLFEERGDQAIDALDGMFALGIWDARHGTLTLARDRAGKKPLFVYSDGTRVAFASEIKALLAHPDLDIGIDESAVPYYFLYGFVPHPQTFYRNVTHLEPGTIATFDRSGRRVDRKYWQLTFPPAEVQRRDPPTRVEAAGRVRDLVTAAVERRLMSDVPLGAFLSGGIDSTIIVGIMSRLLSEPVRTFSIGFEGDAAFDETDAARETARHFKTAHTEFRVTPSAVDLMDRLVYHHDGPFADSSAIPTYLVSSLDPRARDRRADRRWRRRSVCRLPPLRCRDSCRSGAGVGRRRRGRRTVAAADATQRAALDHPGPPLRAFHAAAARRSADGLVRRFLRRAGRSDRPGARRPGRADRLPPPPPLPRRRRRRIAAQPSAGHELP